MQSCEPKINLDTALKVAPMLQIRDPPETLPIRSKSSLLM
jgi:hypothetical protein